MPDGRPHANGHVLPLPEVLVPLAAAKFVAEGNLTDAETRGAVCDLLVSLAAWTCWTPEAQIRQSR